jgi:hypothetical protein
MNRLSLFAATIALVLCFGTPAFAQRGGGMGGTGGSGIGTGAGQGFGHMPNMPSNASRGHSISELGPHTGESSNVDTLKAGSNVAGKKTADDLLTQNTKLSSKLQGLLPAGTSLQDAAKGFDHLGQFVAATHVSHNLGIPFDQLKKEMVSGSSLGEAIHKLKPNVDARQESIRANQQALDDMENSMASDKAAQGSRR